MMVEQSRRKLDRPADDHLGHNGREKAGLAGGSTTLAGQTPPRGSPRATLVVGEVLFLIKNL
jgi:hypothetical protein